MRTRNEWIRLWINLIVLAGLLISSSFSAAPLAPWQNKVERGLLAVSPGEQREFIVFLAQKADLSGAARLKTKAEKGRFVYQRLTETAGRAQPAVLAALSRLGVEARPYWIANMIWVRGDLGAIQAMAQRLDVSRIYANPAVRLQEPTQTAQTTPLADLQSGAGVEWNIQKVNAPAVWAAGFTGQGAVIGGQDTGYDWDHPALKDQYRGWNGTAADHNYNWHDAIHSGGGVCGPDSAQPCDDSGHGTHTMGTMVGDDGAGNQVGMAPGAKWIGCRNMDRGVGSPITYAECYQWFLAPTDLNGQNPRPDMAPDIINNSWGCPASEGCTEPNVLLEVVNNVRAAGILPVQSAGNSGSACSSVATPSAIYDASFTVGATNPDDSMAGFSSRGPVLVDGSGRIKPDISAPGVNIRSSIKGGGYTTLGGTSMAGPHVTGLAALLISATPKLSGQPDAIEATIEQNAIPVPSNDSCGTSGQVPNNVSGWGRIDALKSFQSSHPVSLTKTASDAQIEPGGVLTYTLQITNNPPDAPVRNLTLTDQLPANTMFISATLPYTLDGATIRWDFPTLEASASLSTNLVVQVTSDASGTVDNSEYGISSEDLPFPVQGAPLSIPIIEKYSFALGEGGSTWVWPGTTITYTQPITNTGTQPDMYNLSIESSQGWSALEPSSPISLAPGETALLSVQVNVPENAHFEDVDSTTLTVTSAGNPSKSASAIDTTMVLNLQRFPLIFRNPD